MMGYHSIQEETEKRLSFYPEFQGIFPIPILGYRCSWSASPIDSMISSKLPMCHRAWLALGIPAKIVFA
jgi:hypothetical protein